MGILKMNNAYASENTSVLRQSKRACFYIIWLFFSPPIITSFQLNHTVLWFNNWNSHFSINVLQAPFQLPNSYPGLTVTTMKDQSLSGPDKPCRCAQCSLLLLECCAAWPTAARILIIKLPGRIIMEWSRKKIAALTAKSSWHWAGKGRDILTLGCNFTYPFKIYPSPP